MTQWIRVAVIVAGAGVVAGTLALTAAGAAWRRASARDAAELRQPRGEPARLGDPSAGELQALPEPVRRYLAFAIPRGTSRASSAHIRWAGEFQARPGGGWAPFSAEQVVALHRPGFVWDAEIRMFPLVPMRVRDGYRHDEGSMLGRVGGLLTVVDQGGSREMAQSALARWLGEAIWTPTALLPGGPVRWEPIDENTARATVTDGATTASADFHFRTDGSVGRVTAMRHRDVDGVSHLTPFEGVCGAYVWRDGMRVPGEAEVAWLLPGGRFPYWRGRPVQIRYER